jgi:hypothetical protein
MIKVFWTANAWNAQNCEKVADVVKRANAEVLCITDAKMDEGRTRYMHGYLSTQKRRTGKNWRGQLEPMPFRRTKCSVGSDVIFYSDMCSKEVKRPIIPHGILSSLDFVWGGTQMKGLSVYRPYVGAKETEGAFRNLAHSIVPGFERRLWEEMLKPSAVRTLIGGELNMGTSPVDFKAAGREYTRIPFQGAASTYRNMGDKRIVSTTIDHVLSNTDGSEAWVSSDGLFVGDHFPVIGAIRADGVPPRRSERITVKLPATIKAGDKGARKKLTASLVKAIRRDLTGWSVSQITDWTVKEAMRIQESRNAKNNPDG